MPPIIDGSRSRNRRPLAEGRRLECQLGGGLPLHSTRRSRLKASDAARRRLRWHLRFGPIACGLSLALIRRRRAGGWA